MNKESLHTASEKIIELLRGLNINQADKVELMVNIYYFLNENKYDENIKILKYRK